MNLSGNYVRLLCDNDGVYQYHVHYSPVIDNKRLKMRLLGDHKAELPPYSFDGSMLYLPKMLPEKVSRLTIFVILDDPPQLNCGRGGSNAMLRACGTLAQPS